MTEVHLRDASSNTKRPLPPPSPTGFPRSNTRQVKSTISSTFGTPQAFAIDVTSQFIRAASVLRTGQLVKDEVFTLFEAVSALEVMDPKMDNGLLAEGESLEDDYDVLRDLLPDEIIGIMDQVLCYELRTAEQAAWHKGYPLSQTLFSSIYVNRLLWPDPTSLDKAQFWTGTQSNRGGSMIHKVLRAYCVGTIKACDFVHKMVSSQHYYEEEDFATQLFHRELLCRCDADEIQVLLDDALSWLENTDMDKSFKSAIESRLIFRQEFLSFLQADSGPLDTPSKASLACLPLLKAIKGSDHLGKPVPEAFSLKIQRTLASSVPPRPMITVEFADAISHLERLCHDAFDAYQLCGLEGNENILTAYWTFMSHKPLPSVYVRALAQSFLSREEKFMGKIPLRDFVIKDLASLALPDSSVLAAANIPLDAPYDERVQIGKILNNFISKCSLPYLNYFRVPCLNRCRIRRTLSHAVIEWDNLQIEAEELDADLRILTKEAPQEYDSSMSPTYSYPLSSWLFHYKLMQLEQVIQLGFELAIYAPDELGGMYWYLAHICTSHLAQLDRMSFFTEKHRESSITGHQRTKEKKKSALDRSAKIDSTLQRLFRIYSRVRAMEALARALHRFYIVLMRHGLISKPPRPFSTDKLRHELRMRPFLSLTIPEAVPFETFQQEGLLKELSDREILDQASSAIMQARKSWEAVLKGKWAFASSDGRLPASKIEWANSASGDIETTIEGEWTKDVKDTLRACIASSIAVETLKKRLTSSSRVTDLKVSIPGSGEKDCYHAWWTVPKIIM